MNVKVVVAILLIAVVIDEASADKDSKTVNELSRKIVTLETLGPEYLVT